MKPYGLKRSDCSHRPGCSCCTTKYHGSGSDHVSKDTHRGAKKRARQAARDAVRDNAATQERFEEDPPEAYVIGD